MAKYYRRGGESKTLREAQDDENVRAATGHAQADNDSLRAEVARLQERVKEAEQEQAHILEMSREVLDQRDAVKLELAASRRQGGNARRAVRRGRKQRDGYKARDKLRREALDKYGRHSLLCRYGLLPAGVRGRRSFSAGENERLAREVIKECACGLLAAIDALPEEARNV